MAERCERRSALVSGVPLRMKRYARYPGPAESLQVRADRVVAAACRMTKRSTSTITQMTKIAMERNGEPRQG